MPPRRLDHYRQYRLHRWESCHRWHPHLHQHPLESRGSRGSPVHHRQRCRCCRYRCRCCRCRSRCRSRCRCHCRCQCQYRCQIPTGVSRAHHPPRSRRRLQLALAERCGLGGRLGGVVQRQGQQHREHQAHQHHREGLSHVAADPMAGQWGRGRQTVSGCAWALERLRRAANQRHAASQMGVVSDSRAGCYPGYATACERCEWGWRGATRARPRPRHPLPTGGL